jgi:O-antigen/teichoic acid export membrane protein
MCDANEALPARRVNRQHARNVAGLLLTRVVMFSLSFVASVLTTRALGPTDRGIYVYLTLLSGFLLPFASIGFGASIIFFVSSGRYAARDIAFSCWFVGAVQGCLCALVVAALLHCGCLGKTASETPVVLFYAMLSVLPLQGASMMVSRLLLGTSWFRAHNMMTVAGPLSSITLMFVLVVLLRWGIVGAVVSSVVVSLVTSVGTMLLVCIRFTPVWAIRRRFVMEGLGYGVRAWMGDIALRVNLRLDQFILGMWVSPSVLGVYALAVNLSELLWVVPDSLGLVAFNKLAGAQHERDRQRFVGRLHRVLVAFTAASAVLLSAIGWWAIPLAYGERFADASLYLLLLVPGTVAMITMKVVTKYFGAVSSPATSSAVIGVGALVSVLGYSVFVPLGGATGAAVVCSVAYVASGLCGYVLYRSRIAPASPAFFQLTRDDVAWLCQQGLGALRVRTRATS